MKYLLIFILFPISLFTKNIYSSDEQLDIINGFDIYGNAVKTILNYYIEEVPMDSLIRTGINGMIANLDPYSEYFASSKSNEINVITSGKYFGFGFSYNLIRNRPVLMRIRDNTPAKLAGFKIGDIIISVDSVLIDSLVDADKIFSNINDEIVDIKVLREENEDTLNIKVAKDTIKVNAVTYSEILDGNIGFIKLEQFTINSHSEFQKAFYDLQKQKILKGLIIDLRENSGGIMQEALKICNMFVTQGATLLTTKGKSYNREYKALLVPIDTMLPLVVLIDDESASASEIVAGCLQDLDRATIIGTTSFGKGLVQEVFPLSNSRYLKLTTAKYYTPSGRCIQRINYFNDKDKTDELNKEKIFHTNKGKEVYEMNGIKPDIIIKVDTVKNELIKMLVGSFITHNFITHYINKFSNDDVNIINDSINTILDSNFYNNFVTYATNYNNSKYMKSIAQLDSIRTLDTNKKIVDIIENTINSMLLEYKNTLLTDVNTKYIIKKILDYDYKQRILSYSDFIKFTFTEDKNISAAIEYLNN